MVLTTHGFTFLLHSLRLTQTLFKPVPQDTPGTAHADLPAFAGTSKLSTTSTDPADPASLGATNYQVQPAGNSFTAASQSSTASASCTVYPYGAPDLDEQVFPPFDQAKATVYRYRQQQSVNLGSWFVHEQWMTASLFSCAAGDQISELDIASGWGSPDAARSLLERHWDTFVNDSDFQYLASIGINTVRLPIGYWSLGPSFCQGTPFEPFSDVYQNSWSRVVRAINSAADAGIGVLVDLHGAPGSQNGQPHSGISDGNVNLFDSDWYINKTMSVLTFLMEELVNVTNVVGIQILNEPQNVASLPDFYSQAISTMRQVSPAAQAFPLYIHDGFDLEQYSAFVANRSDFVVQDHHSYFVFTPSDEAEPASQHTEDIRGSIYDALQGASDRQRRNLVVDEFSCALTDQSLAGETDPDQARREFCQGQMDIYQNVTAGWAFWAYNKEQCSDDSGWCFKAAVGNSLPSTFFSYGKGPLADPSRLPALSDMAADMSAPTQPNGDGSAGGPTTLTPPDPEVGLFPVFQKRNSRRASRSRARSPPSPNTPSEGRPPPTRRDDPNANTPAAASPEQLPADPSQRAIAKGYSDGYLTAKIFALYGMSKLGFTGQYVNDSIAVLGPAVIVPGTEDYYRRWFMEGLADGEALITSAVNGLPPPWS
ncbi:glycoside hydrolase [Cubamyces lactineus]|nr:glycoside hydrolase [Cubamyces lactineus]